MEDAALIHGGCSDLGYIKKKFLEQIALDH